MNNIIKVIDSYYTPLYSRTFKNSVYSYPQKNNKICSSKGNQFYYVLF